MRDLIELLVGLLVMLVICFGVVVPFLALSVWAGSTECSTYQQVTGKQTRYAMMSCYINDDGQWFRWDEYKLRNITSGAVK